MASSQLESAERSQPDDKSSRRNGSSFPFPFQPPVVPGSETVIAVGKIDEPPPRSDFPIQHSTDLFRLLFPPPGTMEEVAGAQIGHFTIQRRIGVGGMGAVFLATDQRLRRNVALKVLAPGLSIDPASV
ncbi:MAG: hypothetical protein FJ267_13600, partial [Planctomycetes bacterium]|nr:hypothetical protein [Planctomycetota bacterium]